GEAVGGGTLGLGPPADEAGAGGRAGDKGVASGAGGIGEGAAGTAGPAGAGPVELAKGEVGPP
ncbi:MAG: prolipoprotein diacylglyceryl transferase, partial [Patescibacteria group bacterium]